MRNLLTFLVILFTLSGRAQLELTIDYDITEDNLQHILDFEGINLAHYKIKGSSIKDGYYNVNITEYTSGAPTDSIVLFNGGESDYFKIYSDQTDFELLTKLNNQKLKIGLRGKSFSSKTQEFELINSQENYAVKDFTNRKGALNIQPDKPVYLMAIITPSIKEDGSGSYCEVAQSGVEPELLGKVYNIPHYFIISAHFYKNE